MNPIYQAMMQNLPTNNVMNLMQRFQQFRQMFQGDPKQQVQQLLNSGKVSQAEYNQAVQMANQLKNMLGGN